MDGDGSFVSRDGEGRPSPSLSVPAWIRLSETRIVTSRKGGAQGWIESAGAQLEMPGGGRAFLAELTSGAEEGLSGLASLSLWSIGSEWSVMWCRDEPGYGFYSWEGVAMAKSCHG